MFTVFKLSKLDKTFMTFIQKLIIRREYTEENMRCLHTFRQKKKILVFPVACQIKIG